MNVDKTQFDTEVPIYNMNDELECAVKRTLVVGKVYSSMTEVYRCIGLNYFGLEELKCGPDRNRVRDTLQQYAAFQIVEAGKRPVRCIEIYEIPQYNLPKEDNRGKSGAYIDHLVPLLIHYLWNCRKSEIVAYKEQLAIDIGLVTSDYMELSRIGEINQHSDITDAEKKAMLNRSKQSITEYLKCALNRLMNDYHCITWEDTFWVWDDCGTRSLANTALSDMIRSSENTALKELKIKNIWVAYQQHKENKVFYLTRKILYREHGINICNHHKVTRIQVNHAQLQKYANAHNAEALENMQTTLKKQFAHRIYDRTQNDYQKNLMICKEVAKGYVKKLLEQHLEIADLYDCGVFCENDLLQIAYDWIRQDNSTFMYHDAYLDSWPYIIETYIGIRPVA